MAERRGARLAVVGEGRPGLDHLLNDPGAAWALNPDNAKVLLPRVAALQAVLAVLATTPGPGAEPALSEPEAGRRGDRWLTVGEVAERLGRDRRWVYRRAAGWDFTVKDGKSLMFSELGLLAWMERHRVN